MTHKAATIARIAIRILTTPAMADDRRLWNLSARCAENTPRLDARGGSVRTRSLPASGRYIPRLHLHVPILFQASRHVNQKNGRQIESGAHERRIA
jgi:hypothetical protein